jgi:Na+/proline symporter
LGLYIKKEPKTIKEYALGDGKFSTPVLMYTMVATIFGGGSIIGKSAALYQNGIWLFVASFAMPICSCITALVIIPRLSKYYSCISLAEIIGKMYGSYARRLAGILSFIYCLVMLGTQMKALHWVMERIFIQNTLIATVVVTLIIILYSRMGGISSFVKTDMIHFFIFIIIIPLVAIYVIRTSGGISTITNYFNENSSRAFFHGGSVTAFISIMLYYLLPGTEPHIFHRFLIGRDCKKKPISIICDCFCKFGNYSLCRVCCVYSFS